MLEPRCPKCDSTIVRHVSHFNDPSIPNDADYQVCLSCGHEWIWWDDGDAELHRIESNNAQAICDNNAWVGE